MAKSNALKMKLPSVDDLFSTEETRQEAKLAKIYDIPISEIDDFPVHGIVTIDELEAATGLRFFPDMPPFLARQLKASRPTRLWPIHLRDIFKLILLRFT